MGAVAVEEHRRDPVASAWRYDEAGAFAVVAADFLAAVCPAVGAVAVSRKAALIKVDDVSAAVLLHPPAQGPQIIHSIIRMCLRMARRFFYGCRAGAAPCSRRMKGIPAFAGMTGRE